MRALLSVLVLMLSACGGGGGSGSAAPPILPPPVDSDPSGLWVGSLAFDDQTFADLVGIVTADGRFTLVSVDTFGPDTVGQYVGMATVSGTDLTGTGSAYAAAGATWGNGATVIDFSFTAVIVEKNSLTGTWQSGDGASGSFDMQYDAEYEKDSTLTLLEGVWFVYDDILNPTLTLTMDAGGAFMAQSSLGCQSLGQASIIDANFNVYAWDVTITNCPIQGDYSGFAVLGDIDTGDPNNSQNNAVLVTFSNDQRALLLALER